MRSHQRDKGHSLEVRSGSRGVDGLDRDEYEKKGKRRKVMDAKRVPPLPKATSPHSLPPRSQSHSIYPPAHVLHFQSPV